MCVVTEKLVGWTISEKAHLLQISSGTEPEIFISSFISNIFLSVRIYQFFMLFLKKKSRFSRSVNYLTLRKFLNYHILTTVTNYAILHANNDYRVKDDHLHNIQ